MKEYPANDSTDEETIVTTEPDMDKLAEARKALPVVEDRRTEIYQ